MTVLTSTETNEKPQSKLEVIVFCVLAAVVIIVLVVATVCVAFKKRSPRADEANRAPQDPPEAERDARDLSTPPQVLEPQPVAVQEAPRDELSHQSTMV